MINGGERMNCSDKRELTKVEKSIRGTVNSIIKHRSALSRSGMSKEEIDKIVISLVSLGFRINVNKETEDD